MYFCQSESGFVTCQSIIPGNSKGKHSQNFSLCMPCFTHGELKPKMVVKMASKCAHLRIPAISVPSFSQCNSDVVFDPALLKVNCFLLSTKSMDSSHLIADLIITQLSS